MRCPTCNSQNLKSARMIWESSIRISRYESVSAFAVRVAPPFRKSYFDEYDPVFLFGYAVLWLFFYVYLSIIYPGGHGSHDEVIAANPNFLSGTVFLIVALVILRVVRIARSFHYNRHQFPIDTARWKNTWGCMRCGEVFVANGHDNSSLLDR